MAAQACSSKIRVTLYGKNLCGKFREECGDISGAGADFEDDIGGGELKGFEHDGDHVRLRNGLVVADRQGVIFVGFGTVEFGNKSLAWNAKHGVEDARVGNATGAELRIDHLLTGGDGVVHAQWPEVGDQRSVKKAPRLLITGL